MENETKYGNTVYTKPVTMEEVDPILRGFAEEKQLNYAAANGEPVAHLYRQHEDAERRIQVNLLSSGIGFGLVGIVKNGTETPTFAARIVPVEDLSESLQQMYNKLASWKAN
ncbi:MAG: hypothetical protein CMH61_02150 [Nanoarchaeota archaeon]|nr:hypothetical protein [Nanoarchaeota archaeon]|tara:strand:+ start:394 stop:729 length:336 start_codon:yes stop_codon:yes gene_type:complete